MGLGRVMSIVSWSSRSYILLYFGSAWLFRLYRALLYLRKAAWIFLAAWFLLYTLTFLDMLYMSQIFKAHALQCGRIRGLCCER